MQTRSYFADRDGKSIRLFVDPNHPRYSFSIGDDVKLAFSEETRLDVCEALAPHFADALARWPSDPLIVRVDSIAYALSDNPSKPGKVRVSFARE